MIINTISLYGQKQCFTNTQDLLKEIMIFNEIVGLSYFADNGVRMNVVVCECGEINDFGFPDFDIKKIKYKGDEIVALVLDGDNNIKKVTPIKFFLDKLEQ